MNTGGSSLTVPYDLRPAKQVERRMLLDGLQLLMSAGFHIREYQYTGMGSVFFWDFQLLRRYLGISRMLSVESDPDLKNRVMFNRPFGDIDVRIATIGDIIPALSRDQQHILWLDYDQSLKEFMLKDVAQACALLSPGSILLLTVDVEPPVKNGTPKDYLNYFAEEAPDHITGNEPLSQFAASKMIHVNARIISNAIKSAMIRRGAYEFIPIFSFDYADGHRMLSMGGMIGSESERQCVEESGLRETPYYTSDLECPFQINLPNLTRRERAYLDQNMPRTPDWRPEHFELSSDELAYYDSLYLYMPVYAELLI